MTEKPPGNLRASMTMIAKAPDLEKTIATLKVIAGQYAGAVETNRMEREPAFAEIVNSDGTVQFVKALTEIKERRVSKDVSTVVNQQIIHVYAKLDLFFFFLVHRGCDPIRPVHAQLAKK